MNSLYWALRYTAIYLKMISSEFFFFLFFSFTIHGFVTMQPSQWYNWFQTTCLSLLALHLQTSFCSICRLFLYQANNWVSRRPLYGWFVPQSGPMLILNWIGEKSVCQLKNVKKKYVLQKNQKKSSKSPRCHAKVSSHGFLNGSCCRESESSVTMASISRSSPSPIKQRHVFVATTMRPF